MAAEDLNGDGKNAFIVTNYHSNTVSVLLGNGNGTFKTQTTYATGSSLNAVATGDGNRDGFPDLVVSNEVSKTANVLLGKGNGTFQSQATLAKGQYPRSVSLGDVNGDGRLDVATSNYSSNRASVLLANGNGNFTDQVFTMAAGAAIKSSTSTNLACTSATLGANVTRDGGNTITERGVNYSLTSVNPNPQIGGTGVTEDCRRAFSGFSSDFCVATHPRLRIFQWESDSTSLSNQYQLYGISGLFAFYSEQSSPFTSRT